MGDVTAGGSTNGGRLRRGAAGGAAGAGAGAAWTGVGFVAGLPFAAAGAGAEPLAEASSGL